MDYKKQNKKKVLIGLIIGLIAPILASPIVNAILFMQHPMTHDSNGMVTATNSFWAYYEHNITHPYKLPIFLSFCVLADALVVFFMVQKQKDFMMKGMLFPIIFYALIVFVLKLGL